MVNFLSVRSEIRTISIFSRLETKTNANGAPYFLALKIGVQVGSQVQPLGPGQSQGTQPLPTVGIPVRIQSEKIYRIHNPEAKS